MNYIQLFFTKCLYKLKNALYLHSQNKKSSLNRCENSSVGRARPCQGRGRGFESRFSLSRKRMLEWWNR